MQILINIPNFMYRHILKRHVSKRTIARVFQNGVVLPKGHGRLIDADKLNRKSMNCATYPANFIDIAPTIIEADKEGKK